MPYQPNIPTGSVPLNQDYLNLQGNFSQLNTTYGVDHVPLTDNSGIPPAGITGMHTAIHLVPVSTTTSNPPNNQPVNGYTATPGAGQIFNAQINDGVNTDEALYFLSGGGRLTQLTRNFVPTTTNNANKNGYTFFPGGIIFQWGQVSVPGSGLQSANVNFVTNNINFPSSLLAMWGTAFYTGSDPGSTSSRVSLWFKLLSNTQFRYTINSESSATGGFMWYAIGI